ncbi:MAG TPA: PrgI family protein [Candidatus Paceibacterota bacterium]|nr:PrgI family protein [Candidatus Paceibacterota bacterium]HMP18997.1 PrgI family protein [Candidatus Paceibacterota bacterium]HMP85228.1 PrgI family protein [Candidatus Paceibacterota bacterium]
MRFQVPQFIGIEDRIFGQLTAKQFLYVGAGIGIAFILTRIIPNRIIALFIALPIAGLFFAFAFYKYDGHIPFIKIVENFIKYTGKPKIYIWKKIPKTPEQMKKESDAILTTESNIPKLSDSKLKDLSWELDINENIDK